MGTSKMMGVPMNTPKTSDKTVVGSRVEADKSIEEEATDDRPVVKESKLSICETGSMFCADDVIRAVIGIWAGANASHVDE